MFEILRIIVNNPKIRKNEFRVGFNPQNKIQNQRFKNRGHKKDKKYFI